MKTCVRCGELSDFVLPITSLCQDCFRVFVLTPECKRLQNAPDLLKAAARRWALRMNNTTPKGAA